MTNDWWLQTFMIIIIKVAHAVAINCSSISDSRNDLKPAVFLNQCSHVQWYCFNSSTRDFDCKHIYNDLITCTDSGPALQTGFCVTYSEYTYLLSITDCPYFQLNGFNITSYGYINLPGTLAEINDFMCAPMNRRGIVCSDCVSGFGPSVNSFGYKCIQCSSIWYGILLYTVLELVPMTILYLIVLIFQIRLTSAPMTSFTMYAQFIVTAIDLARYDSTFKTLLFDINGELRLDAKIIHTLYGVFNLDFFHYAIPPFCISDKLKPIHIAFLGYISVFYPLLLILLTKCSIELHQRSIEPFMLVWKPFHKCFSRLRRQWDKNSEIIDVFVTFLYLLYGRCLYQTLVLLNWTAITNFNSIGMAFLSYQPILDPSIDYGKSHHLLFVIPALVIFIIFNVLPLILLIIYPIKPFRKCISKCYTDVDTKVYSCYSNGLNGAYDTRIFAAFYFILRLIVIFVWTLAQRFVKCYHWFCVGLVFTMSSLIIALVKPYNQTYMNIIDCLILTDLSIICYILSQQVLGNVLLLTAKIVIVAPIIILSVIFILKKCKSCGLNSLLKRCCTHIPHFSNQTSEVHRAVDENQQLISPTYSIVDLTYS
jgi:hypothetical protein